MDILEMDLDADINGFAHTLHRGRGATGAGCWLGSRPWCAGPVGVC